MSGDLERRYRRVLRLLPGYYREQWEDDMVAAFLESSLTGDLGEDVLKTESGWPSLPEAASVTGLAARLYLGGAGAPHRYFAWGQAVRRAVLAVILIHAVFGVDQLLVLAWTHHRLFGVPAPPAARLAIAPTGLWPALLDAAGGAWIVAFVVLALGRYRIARVFAVLAILPDLAVLLRSQFDSGPAMPLGPWAFWVLINVVPVLAMAAFHQDAPPADRMPWLLALPATYVVVFVPLRALGLTGHGAWVPDHSGLFCILVAVACLAHAPRAFSRRSDGSGVWSLALTLLAALAGAYRIASLTDYPHDPHLIHVSLAEFLILVAGMALVARDAARAQKAAAASPPHPHRA
jgi:hypothetical protein